MNKIYRVIWNAAKGVWQVSSELGARKGKDKARASRVVDVEKGAVAGREVSRRQPVLARAGSALALEPRVLLDAAGAITALDAVEPVMDPVGQTTALVVDEALVSALWELDTASNDGDYAAAAVPVAASVSTEESLLTDAGASESARELVFIDTSIDNYQALVDATRDGVEVILLDADRDGLQQIADHVAGRSDIDAIHILSHGAEGEKRIGSTVLNTDNLASYSEVLGQIGSSLSVGGDILLYGCHVASGEGSLFVDDLARLTGADVAASDDLTANADRGGNWVLEYETGSIESTLPFDAVALAAFEGALEAPEITDPGAISGLEDAAGGIDLFGSEAVTSPESNTMEVVVTLTSGEGVLDTGVLSLAEVAAQGNRASINSFLDALKFVPTADWNGTATIRVVVETDYTARGQTFTLDLTVTVTPVSDAPLGTSITVTTAEDVPYVITAEDFGFSDPADAVFGATADTFTEVHITTLPSAARGTLTLNGVGVSAGQIVSLVDINAGNLQFEPALDGFGDNYASFTFQVRDSGSTDNGGVIEDPTPKTFTFNVTPVNDSPFFTQGATLTSVEDVDNTAPVSWTLLLGANFRDPDGDLSAAEGLQLASLAGVGISAFDDQGLGEWQISFDGTDWFNLSAVIGGVSNTNALLLSADTLIRFQHVENANTQGSARPTITVHAVESDVPDGAPRTASGEIAGPLTFSTNISTPSTYDLNLDTAESRISTAGVTVDVSIAARNDAPVLTAETVFNGTLIESPIVNVGTEQQQLFTNVTVEDLDIATTGNLEVFGAGSITLTLTDRVISDVFSLAGNPDGVASFSGDTGTGNFVIQLSNTATLDQVKAIIEAIRFENTSDNPPPETRSFNLVLNDGNNLDAQGDTAGGTDADASAGLDSNTLSGSITITGVNDPPLLVLTSNNPTYLENADATLLFSNASIDTIQEEPADNIITLTMTATGVLNGTDEKLTIDGTEVSLVSSALARPSVTITESGGTLTITLRSGGLTETAAATLINTLAYHHISDDPTAGNRVFTIISLKDDGGTASGGEDTRSFSLASTVDVVPVNDPADAQATVAGTFIENGDAIQFLTGITVADLDSTQFNNGWLRVALDSYIAGDTLSIVDGNGITVSGNTISFNDGSSAKVIGTFTGGAGEDLEINFTTVDATIAATEALLGQLRYSSTSENPTWAGTAPTRTVTVTLDDGGNSGTGEGSESTDTDPIIGTFNVTGINDAPTLSNLDTVGANTHIQGGAPVVIDADAALSDLDFEALNAGLGNWDRSTLTIARDGGASVDDIFAATGSLSLTSDNVVVSGITIGTFTNTAGTLAITFNTNATTALVNTALQSITYSNAVTASALAYNTVELRYTFDDQNSNTTGGGTAGSGQDQGSGGQASVSGTITMNINRLPVAVADANALDEGVATTDTSNVSGNVITGIGNTADAGADSDPDIAPGSDDALVVSGIRFTVGDFTSVATDSTSATNPTTLAGTYGSLAIGADGSYTYTLNNTLNAVQQLAVGESLTEEYTYQLSDGQGGFNSTTLTITINGTNDAPTITGAADSATLSETNAALTAAGLVGFGDVDRSNTVATEVLSVAIVGGSATGGLDSALLNNTGNALLNLMSVNGALDGTQINGTLVWIFDSGTSTFDYLNAGESLVLAYTIRVTDTGAHGSVSTDQVVTITINGSNDAPVITVVGDDSITLAITETNDPLIGSGTLTVTDLDYTDTVSVAVTSVAVTGTGPRAGLDLTDELLQTMLSVNSVAVIGDDTTTGTINWSFDSNAGALGEAFDNLAADETLILTYTITATDGNEATDTQTVVITITGSNDAPVISVGAGDSITLAVDETNDTLSGSGTLTVTDLDYSNTVTALVTELVIDAGRTSEESALIPTLATLQGMLSVTPSVIGITDTQNTLTWSFNSGDEYFNYLRSGETLELRYTITVSDGTATDTQDVTVTITGSNDAPLLSITPTNIAELEDAAAQDISVVGVLDITDLDLGDTLTATQAAPSILWSGGEIPADYDLTALTAADVLSFGGTATSTGGETTIGWTYDPAAVDLDWLAVGQTLTITYPVTVSDGQGGSVTQNLVIVITGTNDAPVISVEDGDSVSAGIIENDLGNRTASGTLTLTDIDLSDVVGVRVDSVIITGDAAAVNPLAENVILAMLTTVPDSAIIGDAATSAQFDWEFNSGSVTFDFVAAGETLILTYNVVANDGTADSAAQTITITITGTNNAPAIVSADAVGGIVEGETLTANGTIEFADPDLTDRPTASIISRELLSATRADGTTDIPLTLAQVNYFRNAFSLSALGDNTNTGTLNWTYSVDEVNVDFLAVGERLTLDFTVRVIDSSGAFVDQMVRITVTGTNDAPVVAPITQVNLTEQTDNSLITASTNVNFTDVDIRDAAHQVTVTAVVRSGVTSGLPDNATLLTLVSVSPVISDDQTVNGSAVLSFSASSSVFDYLAANEVVTLTYTVQVADGNGGVDTESFVVQVTGTNDAPVAQIATATAIEDGALVNGQLISTDVDNDATATYSLAAGQDAVAGFTLNATGSWSFDPSDAAYQSLAEGETLDVVINWTVTDDQGATDSSTLTITVTGTNDAPVAVIATASAIEDGAVVNGQLISTDVDNDATATYSLAVGQSAVAGFTLNADGSWSFDPSDAAYQSLAKGELLDVVINWTVTDDRGAINSSTLTITVTGTNDAPVVATIAQTDLIEQTDTSDLTANIAVSFTDVALNDVGHTAAITAATATGQTTGLALNESALIALVTPEAVTKTADSDSGSVTLAFSAASTAFDYLAAGEVLTLTYTVEIDDLDTGGTATQTFVVTITGTNDAAVIAGVLSGEVIEAGVVTGAGTPTASGTATAEDVDNPDNVFQAQVNQDSTAGYGTYSIDTAGLWTYTLDNSNAAVQALNEGQTLNDSFVIRSQDGTEETVTITITGANDAAVIGGVSTGTVVEAGGLDNVVVGTPTATGTLTATDVDNTDNAFQADSAAATYGSWSIDVDGLWTYTLDNTNATVQALNAGQTLSDSFTVASVDGTEQLVSITIEGANDAAVIAGVLSGAVTEAGVDTGAGTPTASGTATAADVDNTDNVFQGDNGAATYGSFTINASGAWTYTLDNSNAAVQALNDGDTLSDSFVIRSQDGTAQAVTITINGANDAATIIGSNAGTVFEDAVSDSVTGTLTVLDPNPGEAIFQEVGPEALSGVYGEFVFDSATGAWVYTLDNGREATQALAADEVVTETLTVTSLDGSASETITITINGVNDAALIGGQTAGSLVDTGSGDSPSTVGTLTASDIDNPDDVFQPDSGQASYGVWIVDSDGTWEYTLNPDSEAVQALGFDEILQDSFVVRSQDGTEALITIEIVGGRVDDSVFVPLSENQPGLAPSQSTQDDTVLTAGGGEGDFPAIGESVLVIDTILGGVGTNYESFVNESIVVDDQFLEDQQTTPVLRPVLRPLDRLLTTTDSLSFKLQNGTFVYSDPAAALQLEATLIDGSPLPDWIRFDSGSGEFTVLPPEDLDVELQVKVTATDGAGNQASVDFTIRVKTTNTDAETEVKGDATAGSAEASADRMVGKPALSAQFAAETETNVLSSALGFIAQLADIDNYSRTDKTLPNYHLS